MGRVQDRLDLGVDTRGSRCSELLEKPLTLCGGKEVGPRQLVHDVAPLGFGEDRTGVAQQEAEGVLGRVMFLGYVTTSDVPGGPESGAAKPEPNPGLLEEARSRSPGYGLAR